MSATRRTYTDREIHELVRRYALPSWGGLALSTLVGGLLLWAALSTSDVAVRLVQPSLWNTGGRLLGVALALLGFYLLARTVMHAGFRLLRGLRLLPMGPRLEWWKRYGVLALWPRGVGPEAEPAEERMLLWGATLAELREPLPSERAGYFGAGYAVLPLHQAPLRDWLAGQPLDWGQPGGLVVLLPSEEVSRPRVYFLELEQEGKR